VHRDRGDDSEQPITALAISTASSMTLNRPFWLDMRVARERAPLVRRASKSLQSSRGEFWAS
jgi:hypothetical protein